MKDDAKMAAVKRWTIEKRDAAGELFEVVEGGDGIDTHVTFRRPGEPPESYASLPYNAALKE